MKKKGIIFSFIGVIIVSTILIILISKNGSKTFMQDGVMFAVTVDGNSASRFPNGDNYYVNATCTNAKAQWKRLPNSSGNNEKYRLFIYDVTGNVACDVSFTSVDPTDSTDAYLLSNVVKTNATNETSTTSTNTTLDVTFSLGYRYEGTNPNNYIWFNNEMWRIIGLVTACKNSSCSQREDLVKIIRNNSLGSASFDAKVSGYSAAWGNNTLYTLLNDYYYGKENATSTDLCKTYWSGSTSTNYSKPKCDYTVVGIDESDYYGMMVPEVYWNAGTLSSSLSGWTSANEYKGEFNTLVNGHVGLMNASDYWYGDYDRGSNFSNVNGINNWLYKRTEFIMNSYSSTKPYYISSWYSGRLADASGTAEYSGYAYYALNFRPVVYLDSSVYVVGGNGTEEKPYQVAMDS